MSSNKRAVAVSAVDPALLEELVGLSEIGIYGDLLPVVPFVLAGKLGHVLSALSQFATSNEIVSFLRHSEPLGNLLDIINYVLYEESSESANLQTKLRLLEERDKIAEFYTAIATSHIKMVYKILSVRKPRAVSALARILTALVEFKQNRVLTEFVNGMDFSNAHFLKIFVPSKDEFDRGYCAVESMRGLFISFWLALCARVNSTLRKSFLTNFKIMNTFWKYLEMDRYELLADIIRFVDKKVLSEASFKRSSKTQILNENFMYSTRPLVGFVIRGNVRKDDSDEDDFSTFKKEFSALMDVIVTDKNLGLSFPHNSMGAPLEVNGRTFKVNNKLIYTLLTTLKPWETHSILQYVLRILDHNPELVAPYMNWIVSNSGGYHNPALSAYWVGHTLLYTEILKSKAIPATPDTISLAPLSQLALKECLEFSNDLVKQLTLQLIVHQLRRLKQISNDQSLVEAVLSTIPPYASFLPLIELKNHMIKLSAILCIRNLEDIAPSSSSAATVSRVNDLVNKIVFGDIAIDSFNLVVLENALKIQANSDVKWWNKGAGDRSFFTSLVKMSQVSSLKGKLFAILDSITLSTILFESQNLIASPIVALIEASLLATDNAEFWNCLDEAVSRGIKTPYKYLDVSHEKYENISIFFVVLVEQLTFAKNKSEVVPVLTRLFRDLAIIGASPAALDRLASDHGFNVKIDLSGVKVKGNITSKFDFASAVTQLNFAIEKSDSEGTIFNLFLKLGNFLVSTGISDPMLVSFISNSSTWKFLDNFRKSSVSQKAALAFALLSEMLEPFASALQGTSLSIRIQELCTSGVATKIQAPLSKWLWILTSDQLKELANSPVGDLLRTKCYLTLSTENVPFELDYDFLIRANSPYQLRSILISRKIPELEISRLLESEKYEFLLEEPNESVEIYLLSVDNVDDRILYKFAAHSKKVSEKFSARVKLLAFSLAVPAQSIQIFNNAFHLFESDSLIAAVTAFLKNFPTKTFTPDFVELALQLSVANRQTQPELIQWIQSATIYVTKKFAESSHLSEKFVRFLGAFCGLIIRSKIPWTASLLEAFVTQLEVLLGHRDWILREEYLRHACEIAFQSKFKPSQAAKLIQIFLNNPRNALTKLPGLEDCQLRIYSALTVRLLYDLLSGSFKTELLLEQILVLYLGTTRAEDLIIKEILRDLENHVSRSWISKVTNWDISEEMLEQEADLVGQERLIIKDQTSCVLALNKSIINRSIREMRDVPQFSGVKSMEGYLQLAKNCDGSSYLDVLYDPEFLMLAIINNSELVEFKEDGLSFKLTRLIESKLLQFVVTALALPSCRDISKIILQGILKFVLSEDTRIKDKSIITIYVASILHTILKSDHSTSLVWHMVGSFAGIITDPAHTLYDRVCRYVLSTPIHKEFEIPLHASIIQNWGSEEVHEENEYQGQMAWFIQEVAWGVKTPVDLRLLRYKDLLEAFLMFSASPYLSGLVRLKILLLLYDIQQLGTEGTHMLVTRYSILSSLETMKGSLSPTEFSEFQLKLNLDQIAARIEVVSRGLKRLREWLFDDIGRAVKRIHEA